MKNDKIKYYTLVNILKELGDYYVIFGERSNGKTFSVLERGIKKHIESNYKEQLGIIRRYDDDFKGKNGTQQFEGFVNNPLNGNLIEQWTKGKYNGVTYQSLRWYLSKTYINEKGTTIKEVCEYPFAFGFAINVEEHYKSFSYPNITTILFDEFISRKYYINDEFIMFQNLLSTIIRDRENIEIFMCGNTINKYNPYFKEMGLTNAKNMKKGTIDVYTYGESDLRVVVEYSDFPMKKKKSDKYFAFDNPKLKMITNGGWELSIYPHLPVKYRPMDIYYTYFIIFDDEILQCEIINVNNEWFTYIHRKTTPLKKDNENIVYQMEYDYRSNFKRNIKKYTNEMEKIIYSFFVKEKVFYQNNEVGELVNNYLVWCNQNK